MFGNAHTAKQIYVEACVTQSILMFMYIMTITRTIVRVKLDFILTISVLLFFCALLFILECLLQVKYYDTDYLADASCSN